MIIVFAGAGSSASINKLDYPTTVEFYNNNLPDDVKSDLRTIVDGHLYSYLSKIKKKQ